MQFYYHLIVHKKTIKLKTIVNYIKIKSPPIYFYLFENSLSKDCQDHSP
jgi:hypothetical protein